MGLQMTKAYNWKKWPGLIVVLLAIMNLWQHHNYKKNIAKTLVLETFKGSINLLDINKMSADKLVNTVATKGGTTEA